MELESIGKNIRKFRLMRNLRQEDLAEKAGLSINYVGALERGQKIPSLETFILILNALEVSSDMVLSNLLVKKHQADASRLMDRMQGLPAHDVDRILAVVDVLIRYEILMKWPSQNALPTCCRYAAPTFAGSRYARAEEAGCLIRFITKCPSPISSPAP